LDAGRYALDYRRAEDRPKAACPRPAGNRNGARLLPVRVDVSDNSFQGRGLPPHIEEAIRSIARLHAAHHEGITPFQRALRDLASLLANPWAVGVVTALAAGWVCLNLLAPPLGFRPPDPPPFVWLGDAISLGSLYMVVLIYATQRHDDRLAQLREQLTLELALLGEQKAAKMIQLLEEFRRDTPQVHDRIDRQADAMAEPVDPERVIERIKETHGQAEEVGAGTGR
jgi:uncharacterized membrane protein